MTQPEDRDWERLLERVDLEMSDADLAAAEEELRRLTSEDVVPVRAEWVDAAVAKARELPIAAAAAAAAERAPLALVRRPRFGGLQRLAAAVLAFLGLHSTAAAAVGVTAVVVGAVVTASALWPEMRNSREMTFATALQILVSEEEPADAHHAAMAEVNLRLRKLVAFANDVILNQPAGSDWQVAAAGALDDLRDALSHPAANPMMTVGDFDLMMGAVEAGSLQSLATVRALAVDGVCALQRMASVDPDARAARDRYLTRLRVRLGL